MLNKFALGIIIGILFTALVILFCFILIKLYIQKIKNYTKVIYQKDIDFQKTLNTTIIETQEQVLNNISQDLHDDAGQQLTYINFQIENLKLDSPELNMMLEPITQSVGQLSSSIRGISHSLNNQLLMQQNLIKAIEGEVERLQKNDKFHIDLTVKNKSKKTFSTHEKIVIYRIFQELINNVLKHSKATEVAISINMLPHFAMTVADNGKGFDTNTVSNNTLGLQNMISRAAIIGYSINIESTVNEGTRITLSEQSKS